MDDYVHFSGIPKKPDATSVSIRIRKTKIGEWQVAADRLSSNSYNLYLNQNENTRLVGINQLQHVVIKQRMSNPMHIPS